MANDRSKFFFNVLALENILVALNREIGDGPCFLYIKFSCIGVLVDFAVNTSHSKFLSFFYLTTMKYQSPLYQKKY